MSQRRRSDDDGDRHPSADDDHRHPTLDDRATRHPSKAERAARVARFLRQIPDDLLNAVARPFSEAMDGGWTACGRPGTRAWDEIVGPVPAAPGLVVDIQLAPDPPSTETSPHPSFQGHIDFMTTERALLRVDFVRQDGDGQLVLSNPRVATDTQLACIPVALAAQVEPALRAARRQFARTNTIPIDPTFLRHKTPLSADELAALRSAIDAGDASGVFDGDPFGHVRAATGLKRDE